MSINEIEPKFYRLSKRAKSKLENVEDYGLKIDDEFIKQYSDLKVILLNKPVIQVLKRVDKDLPSDLSLCITYGYRTLKEQTNIVKQTEKELKKSNPDNWEELLNKYTGGYEELKLKKISDMNHRSGNAVDIKLLKGNKELDLGGQQMNEKDNIDYYERHKPLNKTQVEIKDNRKMLKSIMEKHGFENYPDEWWHWGFTK